jgi:Zn-dependent metalloprotease
MRATHRAHCIMPPFLLERLLRSSDEAIRQAALATLTATERLRGRREVQGLVAAGLAAPDAGRRSIFDCRHDRFLPEAELVRSEQDGPVADPSVNQAFDGLGRTRTFYRDILHRDSIDGRGLRLQGFVHYGSGFGNAFWDGRQMVFGDGDGRIFGDLTGSLDVIAHELAHGVTEHTAGLEYHRQSGALNESLSDVFGSLVKQWHLQQSADQADWLIGADVFTPGIGADALRSMKAPGTAYDNDLLGKDPQPDHMDHLAELADTERSDNGGVHINSGIPNKAFFLAATGMGGNAWDAPGHIWYESLRASNRTTGFQAFADTTYRKADELYGAGGQQQQAVKAAWAEVGIKVNTSPSLGRR